MTMMDSVFKFIGSKWFTFFLGIGLIALLPFTWHNFSVVQQAGQLSKFWYLIAVFIINIISIALCAYKFMVALGNKNQVQKSAEW